MKKRNKKYSPRQVVQNPLNYILGGLKKIDSEHLTELNIKNHRAMSNMTHGDGTRDDWDKLSGMINMALVLDEQHFASDYTNDLLSARDAMIAVGKRYLDSKRFIMRGEEMKVLNLAIDIHEAQLNALRVIDVERAFGEVQRRVRHKINAVSITEA